MSAGPDSTFALNEAARRLEAWMFETALPVWWARAGDRERGGWRDQIAQDGSIPDVPRRCRVQGRQTYVYALAGELGWVGPWREAAEHGLDFLTRRHRRPDGLFRTKVLASGAPADDTALLYDQAFVLFGMAALRRAAPDRAGLEAEGLDILQAVGRRFALPAGGFREDSAEHPFQSNPHMHLFEAALAWEDVGADRAWPALADDIAQLCLGRFIDPESGALREFFEAEWRPAPGLDGRIVEPGHQFEWAWLLERWGRLRGRQDARTAARRLFEVGTRHGVDGHRGVAINALVGTAVHDPVARLWPQTERIKAAMALARATEGAERAVLTEEAVRAVAGLELYLQTAIPGLWYDRLDPAGRLIEEPAPASSFYHIACAIAELRGAL